MSSKIWPEIPRYTASPMEKVVQLLHLLCERTSPIMLIGESGTGKEVLAQAIHRHSGRRDHSFVAINCGAIPENLIESELFGYVKGAFTGASQDRPGRIRQAHLGTLFLDEIGELSLLAQTRLLRVLQERKVSPVGSTEEIPVDFRLVGASHRNLAQMVQKGLFREDLYYRLMVFPVELPALRERKMDIPLLAEQIWQQVGAEQGEELKTLNPDDFKLLKSLDWPGNIRQFRHALERYAVYQSLSWSLAEACEPLAQLSSGVTEATIQPMAQSFQKQKEHLVQILEKHRYNKTKAAEEMGMSRGVFLRYLKKCGV